MNWFFKVKDRGVFVVAHRIQMNVGAAQHVIIGQQDIGSLFTGKMIKGPVIALRNEPTFPEITKPVDINYFKLFERLQHYIFTLMMSPILVVYFGDRNSAFRRYLFSKPCTAIRTISFPMDPFNLSTASIIFLFRSR